ncbi:hypothetical protein [Candidatus Methanoperedens nitratireducens]|uniref:SpaA-like prealbumin fold domain-containing protein n=1 Tax=Candidatus Methanoperedens nitratireducens TaxID=1392998 RepID=A0A284VR49_9EURY|nr:hypothetical protein [Candidatus Methanoperedens nitroreducens]SNQ61742.1 exported hypothetical protein [Candidatus Methanoperedens nitroreducens]
MIVKNKTKLVLLSIATITLLLMGNVFQVYAAPSQQPTLVVFVQAINDDGGAMKASDFAVTVTAKDPSPAIFSGSETGTTVTMKNSEYRVTQLAVKGYNVSYSPGCSGRINNNEAKTCVITNDDIAPHLKVIKHVINDNGGTSNALDFGIYVYGNNPTPSSFAGSEVGTDVKINPGWYSVYEYEAPGYSPSYSPECNGQINVGETKTCTITNDDIPKAQLVVIKNVINNDGGTASASDFTMHVDGNSPSPSMFQGSETGTDVTIYEGYYNVWEDYGSYYSQTNSADCSGYIKGGEIKTCTITNDDLQPAHLIVIKNVINNDGGTASASDFTMHVDGNSPSPSVFQGSDAGTNVTIYPGWYNVNEYYNSQYSSSFSGDCSAYINPGETKTCTITNEYIPETASG